MTGWLASRFPVYALAAGAAAGRGHDLADVGRAQALRLAPEGIPVGAMPPPGVTGFAGSFATGAVLKLIGDMGLFGRHDAHTRSPIAPCASSTSVRTGLTR